MTYYIVVWKDAPGQRVSTVVNDNGEPMHRSVEYLEKQGIPVIEDIDHVLATLEDASGVKFAVPAHVARATLGWDV